VGVELERRHEVGLPHPALEPLVGCAERAALAGPLAQPLEQARLAAVVGELEQLLLVEPQERALEQRRQGQVVLGQKGGAPEDHEVPDRDVLGELAAGRRPPPARPPA
jgi:hypothetical protein